MANLYTASIHGFPEWGDPHMHLNNTAASPSGELLSLVTIIASSMSLVGLVFAFLVHSLFSDVRSVTGIGVMNLLATLFVAQVLFLVQVESARGTSAPLCLGLAFSLRFFWLAIVFWATVLMHHLLLTIRSSVTGQVSLASPSPSPSAALAAATSPACRFGNSPNYRLTAAYSVVAWGFPLGLVLIAAAFFSSSVETAPAPTASTAVAFLNLLHKRHRRFQNCWFTPSSALHYFFDVPMAILTAINIYHYIRTALIIRYVTSMQMDRKIQKRMRKRGLQQLYLHIKLYVIFLLVWILEISADLSANRVVWYLFVIVYSLHGGMIALIYACNARVMKVYMESLRGKKKGCLKKCNSQVSHSSSMELLSSDPTPEII